jgi:hypothetical protein
MITSAEWLNPTRVAGIAAYATAAGSCGFAWIRAKNQKKDSRLAALLTLIETTLLLDIIFNWRWMLHDFASGLARRAHEYDFRRLPQLGMIVLLGGLLFLSVFVTRRSVRGRPGAFLAVTGALLSLVLWGVEAVSLHDVDHILYHSLGGWMAVSVLWIVACLMTSIGITCQAW